MVTRIIKLGKSSDDLGSNPCEYFNFAMTLDYLPNKDEKYFSVGDNLVLTGRLDISNMLKILN